MIAAVLAFIVGMVSTGTAVQRQIWVSEGRVLPTAVGSCVVSVSFFFGTYFVAKDQLLNYLLYALGGILITTWIAWDRSKTEGSDQ